MFRAVHRTLCAMYYSNLIFIKIIDPQNGFKKVKGNTKKF